MGRMERLGCRQNTSLELPPGSRAQEQLYGDRRIDDYHRPSRSARTASAGASLGETGVR
jgi:hypothetical protein